MGAIGISVAPKMLGQYTTTISQSTSIFVTHANMDHKHFRRPRPI